MTKVAERIQIGSDKDCPIGLNFKPGLAVVHACKTCHARRVGYKGSLKSDHPNYLWDEVTSGKKDSGGDLFLNLIDPPVPLFKLESFKKFLDWATPRYEKGDTILIHCNQGESRAPSLALLLVAKLGLNSSGSYQAALNEFKGKPSEPGVFPNYKPGKGIETFLTEHWNELV
jgi:hypothetical protein